MYNATKTTNGSTSIQKHKKIKHNKARDIRSRNHKYESDRGWYGWEATIGRMRGMR